MDRIRQLNVFYHKRKVGTLALYKERLAAFEYDQEWLEDGFTISPFSLPLEKGFSFRKSILLAACSGYLRTVCRTDGDAFWWIDLCSETG